MTSGTTASSAPHLPPTTFAPRLPASEPVQGRIDLTALTPNNVGQLRKLNAALFPVRFTEKWYKDVLEKEVQDICKFGLYNDIPVANICCRYESDGNDAVKVHIMTLGTLPAYRSLGIASKLLDHVLSVAGPGQTVSLNDPDVPLPKPKKDKDGKEIKQEPKKKQYKVSSVFLHVQTNNEEAKRFYGKHGFQEKDLIAEYHRLGIEPRSAWLLEKTH